MTEPNLQFDFKAALERLHQNTNFSRSEGELKQVFRARAAALAKRSDQGLENRGIPYLRFVLHDVSFGVKLSCVRNIAVPHWVTRIPGVPEELANVFQFNGRLVSLVDLGALLELERKDAEKKQVVLLEQEGSLLGLMVHRVLGITPLDERDLSTSTATRRGTEFVSGIAADMTLVLDAARLLHDLRFEGRQA